MPVWVQVLNALSVPFIAALAAVIGLAQWRTAQQRAVLDVFDKRWEIYTRLREVVSEVVSHGTVGNETSTRFIRAADGVHFLFGGEVIDYVNKIYNAMLEHHVAEAQMAATDSPNRQAAIESKYRHFKTICDFYSEFPKVAGKYMRMHQRLPSSFGWSKDS